MKKYQSASQRAHNPVLSFRMEEIEIKVEPDTEELGSTDPLKLEPPDSPSVYDEYSDSPSEFDEPPDEAKPLAAMHEASALHTEGLLVEIELVPVTTSDSIPTFKVRPAVNQPNPTTKPQPRSIGIRKSTLKKETASKTRAIPKYVCPVCNKTFNRKDGLNFHSSVHTGRVPHKCEVCKKTFVQKSNLNRHMLIHSGERPFPCDVCKNSFFEKGHLKTHMFTHSGDRPRPFDCHLCPRSFFQRGHLDTHLLTHSGVKPHVCNICDRRFSKKTNLNRHKTIH